MIPLRRFPPIFLAVLVLILSPWIAPVTESFMIGNDPNHRAEFLDSLGNYYLEWHVDLPRSVITFNVVVSTTGYIFFGMANNASSTTRGDYVVAGVAPNRKPYFFDGHALGGEFPSKDPTDQDDYTLHTAIENGTHTMISFSRALDTCDLFDYPITENMITLMWGYGNTDDFQFARNQGTRGSFNAYLLDPDHSPRIIRDRQLDGHPTVVNPSDNLQLWTIQKQMVIPDNTTSYICSMHKAPRLQKKHHLIGFDFYFPDEQSRQRIHHIILYKCSAPGGGDARSMFEQFNGFSQTCVISQRPPTGGPIPTHLCTQVFVGWAIGGTQFFTPPHVGIPLGEREDEYYLLQVHYDNPEGRSGLSVDFRMDMFYTSRLRPNDGGIMGVSHENPALPPSILLPPHTPAQRIFAHCPGECTRRMLPPEGIKIAAGLLHSHNSGRRLRLRHFGDGQEQPWVVFDDNYHNDFQQFRHLQQEVKVLPGDQLTMECFYDNTWTNGSVVGGYSTRQEMCLAFVLYYNRIEDYSYCRSEIVSERFRQRFLGVENVTWNEDLLEWVAVTPRDLEGLTMTEISDFYVDWSEERREELRMFHEAHPHVSRCSRDLAFRDPMELQMLTQSGAGAITGSPAMNVNTANDYSGPGMYPFRDKPYVPEQTCSFSGING